MKIVTVDAKKCVGCGNCEMACAFERTGRTCREGESNIRIEHHIEERLVAPIICLHCETAWCMRSCPVGALYRDGATRAILVDKDRCKGCRLCVMACPYGNMYFDEESKTARKCELCGGNPRCVQHCIAGALNYEEVGDFAARLRNKAARMLWHAEGQEEGARSPCSSGDGQGG